MKKASSKKKGKESDKLEEKFNGTYSSGWSPRANQFWKKKMEYKKEKKRIGTNKKKNEGGVNACGYVFRILNLSCFAGEGEK